MSNGKVKAFTNIRMIDFLEFLHLIHLSTPESAVLWEDAFILTADLNLKCPRYGLWPFDLLCSWWNLETKAGMTYFLIIKRYLRIDKGTVLLQVWCYREVYLLEKKRHLLQMDSSVTFG